MEGDRGPTKEPSSGVVSLADFRELAEAVERTSNALESLNNRTNTLVHLLDILNKRVDRLESQK